MNEHNNSRTHSAGMGYLESLVKIAIHARLEPWYRRVMMCHEQVAAITGNLSGNHEQ
jgi:hypothetical protein